MSGVPGEDAAEAPYYFTSWWWASQKYRIMRKAKRGGDRMIAACWGEGTARQIVAALNAEHIGSDRQAAT